MKFIKVLECNDCPHMKIDVGTTWKITFNVCGHMEVIKNDDWRSGKYVVLGCDIPTWCPLKGEIL